MGCVLAYIEDRNVSGRSVCIYHSTWAGFTLLILSKGQCEGLTSGIGAERNFTPTSFFIAGNRDSSIQDC